MKIEVDEVRRLALEMAVRTMPSPSPGKMVVEAARHIEEYLRGTGPGAHDDVWRVMFNQERCQQMATAKKLTGRQALHFPKDVQNFLKREWEYNGIDDMYTRKEFS